MGLGFRALRVGGSGFTQASFLQTLLAWHKCSFHCLLWFQGAGLLSFLVPVGGSFCGLLT